MLSSAATAWYDISVDDSVPRSIAVAFMQALPHDVLVSILQNLDSGELARIAVTCSDLRRACVIVWPRRQVLVRVHSGERLHVTAHDPYLGIGATLRSPPAGMKTVKAVVVFDRHLVVACVEAVSSHVILYMYLPRSGRWRRLPPPSITSIAACQSIGDRYLIVVDNDGATMLYSLDDKLWHKCPSAPSPHRNGAAGVIRGRDRGAKFDLKTKTWSSIAPMPEGREKMGSCVYKDRLVVAGGHLE
ncbi:unnamed protein product (mitochondrion) [Plasmodiophora brassicae]|uniref:F-box domain-containing protein n=1 Tax=Plasmodiophora brassicae TaxID=37360 RepID=A0A3P3YJU9_PLABS|nr:unnamed protein product [Plasmodiophora brassicae]